MTTDDAPLSLAEKIARARATSAARAAQQGASAQQAVPVAPPASAMPTAPAAMPAHVAQQTPSGSPSGGSMTAQQRLIWDIVRAAQRAGARDLTRREIWLRWCDQSGKPQSDGAVSGRVNELLKTKLWLLERPEERASEDSEALSRPVYIPQHLLNASPQVRGRR